MLFDAHVTGHLIKNDSKSHSKEYEMVFKHVVLTCADLVNAG